MNTGPVIVPGTRYEPSQIVDWLINMPQAEKLVVPVLVLDKVTVRTIAPSSSTVFASLFRDWPMTVIL